jgi:hypothetical protein
MDELVEAVLSIVRHHTVHDPIGRMDLVRRLRMRGFLVDVKDEYADRQAREAIHWLRTNHLEGGRIVSNSRGSGYYMAQTADEIEAHISEEESRMAATADKVRNMRRVADSMRADVVQERLI